MRIEGPALEGIAFEVHEGLGLISLAVENGTEVAQDRDKEAILVLVGQAGDASAVVEGSPYGNVALGANRDAV